MLDINLLHDALQQHEIPKPKRISNTDFTRWGSNNRYWAHLVGECWVFGDFVSGLSTSAFPKRSYSREELEIRKYKIAGVTRENQRLQEQQQKEAAEKHKRYWRLLQL